MSYATDFPHTRTYDTDLGFLISEFEKLKNEYIQLNEKVDNLNNNIYEVCKTILDGYLAEGKLSISTTYDAATGTLTFNFTNLGGGE